LSPAFRTILIATGLIKVVLSIVFADLPPRYDEQEFLELGERIVAGEAPHPWRAPGYQAFVALGLLAGGGRTIGVRLLQALLSTATALVVYRLGRRIRGERAGLAAGAFLAFHPSHVAFSHLLWSETLFLLPAMLAFERLWTADAEERSGPAVTAGLLLGAAALVRSLAVPLLLLSAAWLAGRRRDRPALRRAAGAAIAGILVIAPWSLFVSAQVGRPVLIDTNAGYNLWLGHNEYLSRDLPSLWAVGLPPENGTTEAWAERLAARGLDPGLAAFEPDGTWRTQVPRRLAARGVTVLGSPEAELWFRAEARRALAEDPGGALRRVPLKIAALWAPDTFLPRHVLRDWYGIVSPSLAVALTLMTWGTAAVALIGGPAALAALRPSAFRSLTTAWIVLFLVLHGFAFGVSRMHQPLVPLLLLAVAIFAFDPDDPPDRRRLLRRGLPWAAAALAAWIAVWPITAGVYLRPGPRHAAFARAIAAPGALPLPGHHRLAWMAADAEVGRGRPDEANRLLSGPGVVDRPWSLYRRAILADDPDSSRALLRRALAIDPGLPAALRLRFELTRAGASGEDTR
jgi:4-amino-4-deoxy-L-arabinose transferase-like glycosyltransferase